MKMGADQVAVILETMKKEKCTQQRAQTAKQNARFLLNQRKADQCIVEIVILNMHHQEGFN